MGIWEYYFPNGNKMSLGKQLGNERDSLWTFWYAESGKEKEVRYYTADKHYLINSWSESGEPMVVDGNGDYEFWNLGTLMERGSYVDSLAHGEWVIYDASGAEIAREVYEMGNLLSSTE